ncbi:hypothetical protein [Nannocystis pusilla]|uniref:hypothetical protein n=1 Tax=Nannocystis pusilla TaxID=889268 RepID=UPI003B81D90D
MLGLPRPASTSAASSLLMSPRRRRTGSPPRIEVAGPAGAARQVEVEAVAGHDLQVARADPQRHADGDARAPAVVVAGLARGPADHRRREVPAEHRGEVRAGLVGGVDVEAEQVLAAAIARALGQEHAVAVEADEAYLLAARIGACSHARAAADDVVAEVDPVEVGVDVPEPAAIEDEGGPDRGLAADSLGQRGVDRAGDAARQHVRVGALGGVGPAHEGVARERQVAAAHERARAVAQAESDAIADVDGEAEGEGDIEAGRPVVAIGQPPRAPVEADPLGAQRVLDAVAARAVVAVLGQDGAVVVREPLAQPRQVDADADPQAGEDVPRDGDGDVGALRGGAAVELAVGIVAAAEERGRPSSSGARCQRRRSSLV